MSWRGVYPATAPVSIRDSGNSVCVIRTVRYDGARGNARVSVTRAHPFDVNLLEEGAHIMAEIALEIKRNSHRRMRVINRICRILEEEGRMQQWLACRVGIPESRISMWKRGIGEPSGTQLYEIARVLGVTMESLAGDDDAGGEPPEGR
jgi:ribosome-binding protein aMBF1 (putative translation factor)